MSFSGAKQEAFGAAPKVQEERVLKPAHGENAGIQQKRGNDSNSHTAQRQF